MRTTRPPAATSESGFGNVGNLVHVVEPGAVLHLRLGFEPIVDSDTGKPVLGMYTGKYELYANDPEAPRIILELKGNAR